jgi:hypothetical protein
MNNTLAIFPPLLAQGITTSTIPPSHQSTAIKITSPTTGQQVPIGGGGLNISGTSTDDVLTNCQVSVIINNIKPYQPANATGSGGKDDYSTWDYFLVTSSKYPALIKAGPNNKITAKLVCTPNSLTKWYSVNVTGIVPVSSSSLSPNALATPHPRLVGNSTNMTTTTTTVTKAATNNALFNATMLNITSPTSGQQIPSGSKITISGTSMDDFYTNCNVYLKRNNLPFQKVNPAGFTGASDYSIWKFTFGDKENAVITPGNTNNLTAKISCINNNNDTKTAAITTTNSTTSTDDNNNNITSYSSISIIGINQPPIAVAKTDSSSSSKVVKEGDKVILNGKSSSDPNGDSLTYLWKQIFGDSTLLHRQNIHIVNPNKALATFKVPNELAEDTTFTFALTVTDSYGQKNTNIVSINAISNSIPVADARSDKKTSEIGEQVTLDGTHSHDPDPTGQINSYKWKQTSGSPSVELNNADTATASFTAPRVEKDTTFQFILTVTDNEGAKDKDTVKVKVKAPKLTPTVPLNIPNFYYK